MVIDKAVSGRRRNTTQRTKILDFLKSTRIHPTAEDIYDVVKKEMSTMTLATVYRNLTILEEQGEITKINVGGSCRYEGQEHTHVHGIEKGTGKLIDLDDENITAYAQKKLKEQGYDAENVNIIFTGVKKL